MQIRTKNNEIFKTMQQKCLYLKYTYRYYESNLYLIKILICTFWTNMQMPKVPSIDDDRHKNKNYNKKKNTHTL